MGDESRRTRGGAQSRRLNVFAGGDSVRITCGPNFKELALSFPYLLAEGPVVTTTTSPAVPVTPSSGGATGAPSTQASTPFWGGQLFLPLILLAVFLFFSSKTKRKQQKQTQDMLSNIKKGDRVQTIGGILGTVVEARENEVLVKVDETNNTKIRFSRKAINRLVDEDATEKK
jgi:preprotein translocase subunit YajC